MENNNGFKIVNDLENLDLMEIDNSYKNGRYKKKRHGIAGFFQKLGGAISNWWKNLKKWQKAVCISLSSLTAVVLVALIIFLSVFGYNYNNITGDPDDLGFQNVIDKKIINIALFGVDTRSTESLQGNSDSIMVLSIDTEDKTVKIVSIMRDSLVCIEKNGKKTYNKINSAYATGGPELAIKTLNQNFGLDISEYATVNFYGMAEIVDAVGGIDAELTYDEVSTNHTDGLNGLIKRQCEIFGVSPKDYYIRTPGKHHLNGIQAVAYSRIRKFRNIWGTTNDFGRTDRQRYVMEQLFNKALTLPKSQYVKLVKALIPYTETSLSYSEIIDLATNVLLESPTFEQSRMPISEYQMKAPSIPRVGSVVYYDLEFAKNVLHSFFYDDITPEEYVKANGIRKNDWYAQRFGSSGSSEPTTSSKNEQTESTSNDTDSSKVSSSSDVSSSSKPSSSSQTPSVSEIPSSSETPSSSEEESSNDGSSSSEDSSQEEELTPPDDEEEEEPSDNTTTQ